MVPDEVAFKNRTSPPKWFRHNAPILHHYIWQINQPWFPFRKRTRDILPKAGRNDGR